MKDPNQILREFHAANFLRAYERCMIPPDQGLGVPAIVCAAFSAELALKELLRRRAIVFKRKHRLLDLLGLLPKQESDAIRAELATSWPDLDTQLANADDAFVTWRYFFESPGPVTVNSKFIAALAGTILKKLG